MLLRGNLLFGATLARRSALLAAAITLLAADVAWCQTVAVSAGRRLAPDALEVIEPAMEYGETFQGPVDLPFVVQQPDLAWDPNYAPKSDTLIEMGKQVTFRGDVYCLEFAFKPVRMIEVDIPTNSGVQRKTVWYLLYRLRYLGGDLRPVPEQDAYNNQVFATPQAVSSEWVRCMPTFVLQSKGLNKEYLDQILPAAKRLIAAKERVGRPIYDSVEMQKLKIELSTETGDKPVWGVATWVDIDPRTDFFSVLVAGLTNAQRLKLEGDQIKYLQKNLVLNFSRPGDTIDETEDQIRYGIPALENPARQKYVLSQFGLEERLDHLWIYR
jgi:hypothetical protein